MKQGPKLTPRTLTTDSFRPLYDHLTATLKEVPLDTFDQKNEITAVADEILFIMSLGFLTVGLRGAAIGGFAAVSTIHCLLSQLTMAPLYTYPELKVLCDRIDTFEEELSSPDDSEFALTPELVRLMEREIRGCRKYLPMALSRFEGMNESHFKYQKQLVLLRRELLNALAQHYNEEFDPVPIQQLAKELEDLDKTVKTVFANDKDNRPGCALLVKQIEICIPHVKRFAEQGPLINPSVVEFMPKLIEINHTFELFLMTHRWTLRETDLFVHKEQLDEILQKISTRVECDPETHVPNSDFAIAVFLTRKARALLFKVLDLAEPVDEILSPMYNQLQTTKRCLEEVRDMGGLSDLRELYPYQMKLASIDNARQDGKFVVNNRVPAGQAAINAVLSECFELCHELKLDLETREEDDDEDDEEGDDDDEEDEDDDE